LVRVDHWEQRHNGATLASTEGGVKDVDERETTAEGVEKKAE